MGCASHAPAPARRAAPISEETRELRFHVVGASAVDVIVDGRAGVVDAEGVAELTYGEHSIQVAASRCKEGHESVLHVNAQTPPTVEIDLPPRTRPLTLHARRWDGAGLDELVVNADDERLQVSAGAVARLPRCAQWLEVRTATLGGLYERLNEGDDALAREVLLSPGPSSVAIAGATYTAGLIGPRDPPARRVTVPSLDVDRTEVTVAQFRQCVTRGGCALDESSLDTDCSWNSDRGESPMDCVTLRQAAAFCRAAGKRLPTSDEWEYFGRSTVTYEGEDGVARYHIHFPWEGYAPPTCEHANLQPCQRGASLAVCSLPAGHSVQGICDLVGNVAELTSTCVPYTDWEPGDFGPGEVVPDRLCAVRGGGYRERSDVDPSMILLEPVVSIDPERDALPGVGFRCVRESR
ncbi:MAG: SUMF1/EgtB/PvdO family nonheme iron enzyme [Myxococcota bacterium]